MMLEKKGGRRERDREIPYTLPCPDLLLKKKTRIEFTLSFPFSRLSISSIYAIMFLYGTRLEEVVKKTVQLVIDAPTRNVDGCQATSLAANIH